MSGLRGCFKCGESGHWAANCPTVGTPTCYKCGKKGHISRDCRVDRAGVSTASPPRTSTTFDRWILQRYAQRFESSSLPPTLLLINTETSLAIFDKYPKAIFHFLLLPRIIAGLGFTANDLTNIQTLLEKGEMVEAKMFIQGLKKDAEMVKEMIEKEMLEKHGYKWDVWIGFHAVPSMLHLHLHVISSDLCSPTLKYKKHYNSFHPKLGFFLHVDEVLSWFEDSALFDRKVMALQQDQHEPLLKEDLVCWRCHETFKTLPKLKEHLTWEKEAEASREKDARKAEKGKSPGDGDVDAENPVRGGPSSKRQAVTPNMDT